MRTLSTRLREAEQIDHPNEADYSRLLILASDMEDEIDRLRDRVEKLEDEADNAHEFCHLSNEEL